jgi:hypothetical protein
VGVVGVSISSGAIILQFGEVSGSCILGVANDRTGVISTIGVISVLILQFGEVSDSCVLGDAKDRSGVISTIGVISVLCCVIKGTENGSSTS